MNSGSVIAEQANVHNAIHLHTEPFEVKSGTGVSFNSFGSAGIMTENPPPGGATLTQLFDCIAGSDDASDNRRPVIGRTRFSEFIVTSSNLSR